MPLRRVFVRAAGKRCLPTRPFKIPHLCKLPRRLYRLHLRPRKLKGQRHPLQPIARNVMSLCDQTLASARFAVLTWSASRFLRHPKRLRLDRLPPRVAVGLVPD